MLPVSIGIPIASNKTDRWTPGRGLDASERNSADPARPWPTPGRTRVNRKGVLCKRTSLTGHKVLGPTFGPRS